MPSSCSIFNLCGSCKCYNGNTVLKGEKIQHGFQETAVFEWGFCLNLVTQGENRGWWRCGEGTSLSTQLGAPWALRVSNKTSCLWMTFFTGSSSASTPYPNRVPPTLILYSELQSPITSEAACGRGQSCHCFFGICSMFSSLQFSCCSYKHHKPKTKAYKNHSHF